MSTPGSANPLLLAGSGYQISRSLRFNSADSAYLNKAVGTATPTNGTKATVSLWVKRAKLSVDATLISVGSTSNSTYGSLVYRASTDTLRWMQQGGAQFDAVTTATYRDPSAWYHIVITFDTNNATASNRNLLYVNGQLASISAGPSGYGTNPAQTASNGVWFTCSTGTAADNHILIGGLASGSGSAAIAGWYFDGLITEVNLIDGQVLTPSSFGETDAMTGAWKPKRYTGTYGTNGFYLNFADNSGTTSTTLGKDSSGNGNNWTPNNFSVTAGTGNDSLIDTPTPYADGGNGRGNYCTLNPLANGGTLANGNLQFSTGASHALAKSTFALPSSGLWYAEATVSALTSATVAAGFGLGTSALSNTAVASSASGAWEIYSSDLRYFNRNGTQTSIAGTFAANDVLQVAVDMANGRAWVGVNNTWYNGTNGTTGDPSAGTNPTFTSLPSELFIIANTYSNTLNLNFGQRPFAYTPPAGFKALNTQNLPEPTIKKPSSYMDVVLWTGNGAAGRSITGLNFNPDLVWLKNRSDTYSHQLHDAVRGASAGALYSNLTNSQDANFPLTSFDASGFTLGNTASLAAQSQGSQNFNGNGFVAWCWDESATPGFDIVTYTGDGTTSANRLIDHSLGVKPDFIITKKRSSGTTDYGWSCWHKDLGGNYGIWLERTSARNAAMWSGYSNFSSTKFTPPDLSYGNENSQTYVNYLWAEVPGFSRFGSYTGNGSSDGPFVWCGFRPRYILQKRSDSSGSWQIWNTATNPYNETRNYLLANTSSAEANDGGASDGWQVDILANGFKVRSGGGAAQMNASGGTYIFAAFAESPFKYSLAR